MVKIIEFHGCSGSGKSILANLSISYLNKKGYEALGREKSETLGFTKWLSEENRAKYPMELKALRTLSKLIPRSLWIKIVDKSTFFGDKHLYKRKLMTDCLTDNIETVNMIYKNAKELSDDQDRKREILEGLLESLTRYENAKRYFKNEIIVLDEAFLKLLSPLYTNLWTENLPKNYKKDIKKLVIQVSPMVDFTFFVNTKPELCIKRQKKRGIIVSKEYREKGTWKGIERSFCQHKFIHQTLKENGVRAFQIDNNGSFEKAKEQLYQHLDQVIVELENGTD